MSKATSIALAQARACALRSKSLKSLAKPLRTLADAMARFVITILFAFIVLSCSSRVVYEPQQIPAASPDAIDINTATVDELERLPYIGRETAEAIIEYRERHGAFRRVEHLMLVRGVSEARLAGIRPFVYVR